MNLAGIFGNNSIQKTTDPTVSGSIRDVLASNENTARAASIIKLMSPGQTIQAQVLAVEGENATLKLANNALIQAALGKNASGLDVGKLMSFEVRGNGQTLSLSPLFTNTASDPTVQKALTMAGLPVNNTSAQMTGALMQAGLPIDRNTLTGVYNEVVNHAQSDVLDIVDLHRLNLPVTDENLRQLSAYKNLTYQLEEGMSDVANKLQGLMNDLAASDPKAGVAILDTVLQTLASNLPDGETAETQQALTAEHGGQPVSGEQVTVKQESSPEVVKLPYAKESPATPAEAAAVASSNAEAAESAGNAAQRALELLARLSQPEQNTKRPETNNTQNPAVQTASGQTGEATIKSAPIDREAVFRELQTILEKETGTKFPENTTQEQVLKQSAQIFHEALTSGNPELAQRLLSSKAFTNGVLEGLKQQWTISPEEVAKKENVEKLFNRLNNQLHEISRALEENGQAKTPAFQTVNNMSANVDFLQQVNQMYAYVQLPIRLSTGDTAHGDLYVYTNGKRLSQNDGHVSALLHLDMEHLGPVDVYVAMDTSGSDSRVSTQFYLPDDETLDFLNEHMDELTARLEKRGYNCSAKLTVRGQEEPGEEPIPVASGINMLLVQKSSFGRSEMSFDVRT
jgi:hypothetical protein